MADPATIFNHDIVMIWDKCNRYIRELMMSQSANVSGMTPHDITRAESYIAALRTLHAWVMSQPILDLPETHPREHVLEDAPAVLERESESINMMIRLLEALRTEMVNSQSARQASTLISHDSVRFVSIVDKMEKFIADYVQVATPLDLPESSPDEAAVGPGRGGV